MTLRKSILVLTLLLGIPLASLSQSSGSKVFTKEVGINVDNDYPFATDQYYTAGQDFYFRFISRRNFIFKSSDSSKTIFTIHYGNKVFNPKNLDTKDPNQMDRPYCGWNFLSAEVQHFAKRNSGNFLAIQFGVVGGESGMGALQQWWHKAIHLYSLEGWDSQISNEFVVNANFNHTQAFPIAKGIEVVTNTGAWVGTGTNKISEEVTLRLFKFNSANESTFMNARLSRNRSRNEFFVFTSFNTDYVISNIFMEGSLFSDNPSPYTTPAKPWFFTSKIGIMYSSNRISWTASVAHQSKENYLVSTHAYATISLAYRF